MKALGIIGSPRVGSNTGSLVERVLEGAATAGAATEAIRLASLSYRPCDACDSCMETGICRIEDDLQPVYAKLLEADALVLGSPIYWHGLSAQTKTLIDRCQCFWNRRFVLRKFREGPRRPGLFVSVGGQLSPRFELAVPTVKLWFGVLGFAYSGQLLVPNVDNPGEVVGREEPMARAFALGKELVAKAQAAVQPPSTNIVEPVR